MGLVGESGCGKSVTSLSIMRLVAPPGQIDAGQVLFDGTDLLTLSNDEMRQIRGDRISMIFQQPTSSLNPVRDVGWQIGEVLELHRKMNGKAAHGRAPSSCCGWSASRTRNGGSSRSRTRCRAAWPSA